MRSPAAVLTSCAVLSLAGACGSSSEPGAAFLEALQGTWSSGCAVGGPGSEMTTLLVSGTAVVTTRTTFTNTACSGTGTPVAGGSGTLAIGAPVASTLNGASVTAYPIDTAYPGGANYGLAYLDGGVSPNRLYGGLYTPSLDGTTPARRPVVIDPAGPMTRL